MFDGSHIHQDYETFIKGKVRLAGTDGFDIADSEINPILKPHQRAAVRWALAGGRRALFESFGLGKSIQQLELLRIIVDRLDDEERSKRHRAIIIAPLGVKQEFQRDAIEILGWHESPKFIKRSEHVTCDQCDGSGEIENEACANCEGTGTEAGLFITNYESIREEKIDLALFDAISLDEVPYRAVKFGRRGIGIELNTNYFLDGAAYCEAAEHKASAPSLFDLLEVEKPAEIAA